MTTTAHTIHCPYCRTAIAHHEVVAGQIDRCRRCGNQFQRPAACAAGFANAVALPQGEQRAHWHHDHEEIDSNHVLEVELSRKSKVEDEAAGGTWAGETQISAATCVDINSPSVSPDVVEIVAASDGGKVSSFASRPWLVSIVAHASVIVFLGLCVMVVEQAEQIELVAGWESELDTELDTLDDEVVVALESVDELSVDSELLSFPDLESQETAVAEIHLAEEVPVVLSRSAPALATGEMFDAFTPAGSGEASVGDKSGSRFFGVEASGGRFVFVVDMSSSMSGNRFERARAELKRSIEDLSSAQQYYIFFYNHQTHPMPGSELVVATDEQKQRSSNWLDEQGPWGGTNPLDALERAVKLEPDAIFVLSDGEFVFSAVDRVLLARREAKCDVPVHTIGLCAGGKVLQTMAERTGGIYRLVP